MGRIPKYQSGAAKQRAYRQRKAREKRNAIALQMNEDYAQVSSSKPKSPPVRYYGGKWRIGSWIIQQFPPHTCYVEPFCGGASVLFQKSPSKFEVINDLNGEVINFFDVLRSRPDDLVDALQLTPFSREEHRRAHQLDTDDPLERARRFYVRSRQSFGSGEGRYNTGWRFQKNDRRGSSCIDEWNSLHHLYDAARRLKNVQIECDDAFRVLRRFDGPETLFYVDPPYMFSTRYSNEQRYRHEMLDKQHIELAEALQKLVGMVLISGYESELYNDLFTSWRRISKDTKTNGNNEATEYLWINPHADDELLPLFSGGAS